VAFKQDFSSSYFSLDFETSREIKGFKLNNIVLLNKSSQSYKASLAIWDHALLPATWHKWTRPPNPNQTGRYSIYLPRRDDRL